MKACTLEDHQGLEKWGKTDETAESDEACWLNAVHILGWVAGPEWLQRFY